MTDLIRITDDDRLSIRERVELKLRFHYLERLPKHPVCADQAKVNSAYGDIGLALRAGMLPVESPLNAEKINYLPAPKPPMWPCVMPRENKMATASRTQRCTNLGIIPCMVPTLEHGKAAERPGIICHECYGKVAVMKMNMTREPEWLTDAEVVSLERLGGLDPKESDFINKQPDGTRYRFHQGFLMSKPPKEKKHNADPILERDRAEF